ncbi:MAG: hypothetical protein ACKOXU_05055 [Limnohabitans sp.]
MSIRAQFAMGRALPPLGLHEGQDLPSFELTYIDQGRTWKALVRARNVRTAEEEGRLSLAFKFPDFNAIEARLCQALQVH